MRRIDLSYFYTTGELIHPLTTFLGDKIWGHIWHIIYEAYYRIDAMIETGQLRSSYLSAKKLLSELSPYINPVIEEGDFNKNIEAWRIKEIARCAYEFKISYTAELAIEPVYIVTPKGGYDVNVLTLYPEQAFPHDLTTLIEKTKYDVEQAGKCLAFEAPTAAAFHLHRINEAVVHRYWEACTKEKHISDKSSIGNYLNAMKSDDNLASFDKNVLAVLEQINTLHRNPALHPENNLTSEEAIELFGIIVSAVSAMLKSIRFYQEQKEPQALTSSSVSEEQSS